MTSSFPDEALYTLLCKYLLQEADGEERAWVEAWLGEDAGNAALLAALQRVLDTAAAQRLTMQPDTDSSWQRLYSQMGVADTATAPPLAAVSSRPRFPWIRVAAILALALGLGWWLIARNSNSTSYAGPQIARLEDGSSVQLQAASRLEVAPGFGSRNRKVTLKGAATFDIAANAAQPFVVTLGRTDVQVLGTRFTVNYEPGQAKLQVHVSSGKVMVIDHEKADSVVLTEGMLLQQDQARPDFRVAAHVTDPVKKALAFHHVPLEEVLHTITEVYDVRVTVEDTALLKLSVNTNFTGESIDEVITTLALSVGAKWEKTGDRQYKLR
ncbi:FecR family protein [Chitinophaga vietnamensis]|uniref:FecR family protein n=1 Tax=Chitinophaga vietnamensis TaxID=2593957 RepID=UPI00117769AD|nr:FecR domain-containing protein [Chitinophaga vietnamensis]